jgi:hypothetical protein
MIDLIVTGAIILGVVLGVTLGMFTAPPLGRRGRP